MAHLIKTKSLVTIVVDECIWRSIGRFNAKKLYNKLKSIGVNFWFVNRGTPDSQIIASVSRMRNPLIISNDRMLVEALGPKGVRFFQDESVGNIMHLVRYWISEHG